MTDPSKFELSSSWDAELEKRNTVEKVYDVVLQLDEPLRVSEIADRAGVAPDTARKYLTFLSDVGVANKRSDDPATFRRSDSYLEWRQVDRLRTEYSVDELESRLSELADQIQSYQSDYEVARPRHVNPQERGYENIQSTLQDLRQWEAAEDEVDDILKALGRDSETDTSHIAELMTDSLEFQPMLDSVQNMMQPQLILSNYLTSSNLFGSYRNQFKLRAELTDSQDIPTTSVVQGIQSGYDVTQADVQENE